MQATEKSLTKEHLKLPRYPHRTLLTPIAVFLTSICVVMVIREESLSLLAGGAWREEKPDCP